jgi:2-amino-4-hydroxy-6-hydroxymethyldihydropteridine diphosphokinase
MAHVRLSVGANLGDREAALQSVVDAMPGRFTDIRVSSVYDTPPWGLLDQPTFLNAAIAAETELSPSQVLTFAHECEAAAKRLRDVRWGPRTLDVDVISYDDVQSDDPALTLPHPRAHERAFVLVPLAELEPAASLVGYGSVPTLLAGLDQAGITIVSQLRVPA